MRDKFFLLRLWSLIAVGYLKRNSQWFIPGMFLLVLTIFLQAKFGIFYTNTTLRIGLIGTYQEHDIPEEVTKLLSQPLLKLDEEGHLMPNLVSGWETNNDATQFRFKLKDNLKWVNNTAVKSQDISFNIPNTQISFPDDKTIQFNLKEPYSPLPSLLTRPIFKKGTLMGVGPYQVEMIDKSRIFITKMTLKGASPTLPALSVRFYPNEAVGVTGFNLGEVQVLMGLNNPKIFYDNPKVETKRLDDFQKMVTVLFQTRGSLLENRSLRQALSYIIPKMEGEIEANNPYPPKHWARDPDAKKYLSNKDEAAKALERARTSLSADKLKSEIILTATPNLAEVGKMAVDSWKSLGLDGKLRIESGIPQNFQALLITQSIPYDPDQYFLWHATQTKTNLSKYDSKRADKDLEDGRKEMVESERKIKYFDFQKTLLEDAPAVFLYFPKYNIVYLKKAQANLDRILKLDNLSILKNP